MTKKQFAAKVEALVEAIAVAHGATIVEKQMKVGGRDTTVREAEGGMFDLDGARRVLAHRMEQAKAALTGSMNGQPASPATSGPKIAETPAEDAA